MPAKKANKKASKRAMAVQRELSNQESNNSIGDASFASALSVQFDDTTETLETFVIPNTKVGINDNIFNQENIVSNVPELPLESRVETFLFGGGSISSTQCNDNGIKNIVTKPAMEFKEDSIAKCLPNKGIPDFQGPYVYVHAGISREGTLFKPLYYGPFKGPLNIRNASFGDAISGKHSGPIQSTHFEFPSEAIQGPGGRGYWTREYQRDEFLKADLLNVRMYEEDSKIFYYVFDIIKVKTNQ